MNRIETAIEQCRNEFLKKELTSAELEQASKLLDIDIETHACFQDAKSLAVAEGMLSVLEANTIFGYLGHIPSRYNKQPLHVKITLTRFFQLLLGHQIDDSRKRGDQATGTEQSTPVHGVPGDSEDTQQDS